MTDAEETTVPRQSRELVADLYRAAGLGAPVYVRSDVARLAGTEHERSVKWWRAMGLPEVPEDVPVFTERDIEIVRRLASLTGAGLVDDEAVLRSARLLGASFSRIAEAQVAGVEEFLDAFPDTDPEIAYEHASELLSAFGSVLDLLEDTLVYVWRRHLVAALGRRLETGEGAREEAVGFADLSGFTKLAERVSADRLAQLVDEFENAAFDAVSSHGGRVVKLIGDELMFRAESVPLAVDVSLDLAERLRAVDDMPPIHCGIAYGPTVPVGGDVFGPAVNLAARLTAIARRGSIVIPRAIAETLVGRDDIELVRIRHAVDIKGIGDTRIVGVRRKAGAIAAS